MDMLSTRTLRTALVAWLTLGVVLLYATSTSLFSVSYVSFEQITVADTSIGFTAATIDVGAGHPQVTIASCRIRTAELNYRVDGGTPTSTVGTVLSVGDIVTVTGYDLIKNFLAIRTGGTSGQLDCTYYAP